MTITEVIVKEGGDGKGPHDAISGHVNEAIRAAVRRGAGDAKNTADRLRLLRQANGRLAVPNMIFGRVVVRVDTSGIVKQDMPGINNLNYHTYTYDGQNITITSARTAGCVVSREVTVVTDLDAVEAAFRGAVDPTCRGGPSEPEEVLVSVAKSARAGVDVAATDDAAPPAGLCDVDAHVELVAARSDCAVCGTPLHGLTVDGILDHIRQHALVVSAENGQTTTVDFVCPFKIGGVRVCGHKFVRKAASVVRHVLEHMGAQWQCRDCAKLHSKSGDAHECCAEARVRAEADALLVCGVCLATLASQSALEKHSKICKERAGGVNSSVDAVHDNVRRLFASVTGSALYAATIVPQDGAAQVAEYARWLEEWPRLPLFDEGFGSQERWRELKPIHRKSFLECVVIVVLWHVGEAKVDLLCVCERVSFEAGTGGLVSKEGRGCCRSPVGEAGVLWIGQTKSVSILECDFSRAEAAAQAVSGCRDRMDARCARIWLC